MAEIADQTRQEFWRPPLQASEAGVRRERSRDRNLERTEELSETCRCGTEFIVSSIYCHSCGARRPDLNTARILEIPGVAELAWLRERLGLTTPALIAFLLGVLCLLGAVAVSVFFSVRTALDWQAIQLWRIEWLLGAVAAFVAGCGLRK
jgi:hypothetical protein